MKKNQLATDKDSKKTSLTKIAKQTPVKITPADETRIKNTLRDLLECYYYHKNYIFEWSFLFTDSTPREELNFDIHGIILNTLGIENNELADAVSEAISDSDIPQLDASDSADFAISNIYDLIQDDGRYKIAEFSKESCLLTIQPLIAMDYVLRKLTTIALKGDTESAFERFGRKGNNAINDNHFNALLSMINKRYNAHSKNNVWDICFDVLHSYIVNDNPFTKNVEKERIMFIDGMNKMINSIYIKV